MIPATATYLSTSYGTGASAIGYHRQPQHCGSDLDLSRGTEIFHKCYYWMDMDMFVSICIDLVVLRRRRMRTESPDPPPPAKPKSKRGISFLGIQHYESTLLFGGSGVVVDIRATKWARHVSTLKPNHEAFSAENMKTSESDGGLLLLVFCGAGRSCCVGWNTSLGVAIHADRARLILFCKRDGVDRRQPGQYA